MKCHSADEQKGRSTSSSSRRSRTCGARPGPGSRSRRCSTTARCRRRMLPSRARRAEAAAGLGCRLSEGRVARQRRRPRPGRSAPAQQCRVHLHAARSDGRRSAARPRVSGRWRRRRRVYQHRQRARHVAGLALEIPGRRQEDRQPRRAVAGRHSIFAREPPGGTGPTRRSRGSEASTLGSPTRAAARRSICKGLSSAPTTAGGCRWKNTCAPRSGIATPSPRAPRASRTSRARRA